MLEYACMNDVNDLESYAEALMEHGEWRNFGWLDIKI
jgi:hypothetical protein